MTRYRVVDADGNVIGELRLSDGLSAMPELASPRQIAAFGAKCGDLARVTGRPKPDWEQAAREATAAEHGLDPDASRSSWTWEQMHWALDWLQAQLDAALVPSGE